MTYLYYLTESAEENERTSRGFWILATSKQEAIDKRALYNGKSTQSIVVTNVIVEPPYSYIVDAWPTEYGNMLVAHNRSGTFTLMHTDTCFVTTGDATTRIKRETIMQRFRLHLSEPHSFVDRIGIFEKYDQSVNHIKASCSTGVFPQTSHGWSFGIDGNQLCVCFENEVDAMAYRLMS